MSKLTDGRIYEMYESAINMHGEGGFYVCKSSEMIQLIDRLRDAERRLQAPVRLPVPQCDFADHSYPAYSAQQVKEIINNAGLKVEDDEQ